MIGTSKGWTQFLQSRGMFTKVVLFAYSIMLTVNGCWALCISEQKIFSLDSEFARSDQIHVALLFPNPAFYYFITPLFFLKEQFLTFIPVVFIWYISRSSNPLFFKGMEVNFNYLPWRGIWKIKKGAGLLKGRERGWSCWQFSYLIFSRFIIFRFIFLPPYFYEKSHSKLSRNLVFWIRARGGCLHERGGTVWSTLEGGGIEKKEGKQKL